MSSSQPTLEETTETPFIVHPLIRPDTIEYRSYQVSLAVACLRQNTLLVLPTGLGKTVVALLAIADRLKAYPDRKILFLAPTKPLVEQHAAFLRDFLVMGDPERELAVFSGETPPEERTKAWPGARILVSTPQVIENDLINGKYDLKNVSLIVYDEGHRSVGDYSYVFVAERYLRDAPLGLALGMTASPGSTHEKILEVCVSLGLKNIEARTEFDRDVRPYVHELNMEWLKVTVPESLGRVVRLLREVVAEKTRDLKKLGWLQNTRGEPTRRDLLMLAGEIRGQLNQNASPQIYSAMSLQAQVLKVSHALELTETQGASALANYFSRLKNEADSRSGSKASRVLLADNRVATAMLIAAKVEKDAENPKVEKVVELVANELKDPEKKVIVFTHYRDTCDLVTERLRRLEGARPVRFVGQSSRGEDKGLTQKEQRELIEEFRLGVHNVLVATSVAEEGLDIPDVDLVVFFEPIPSEIRTIQRRGRTGRKRAGRAVVLMTKGTRDEAYYWSAHRKEKAMREELALLQRGVEQALTRLRAETGLSFDRPPINPFAGGNGVATAAPASEAVTSGPPPRSVAPPPTAPSSGQRTLAQFWDETTDQVRVVVDHREYRSGVVRELARRGATVQPEQLATADYMLSRRVAVERKAVDDFLQSMVDGRLFGQMRQLRAYLRPLLIVEGDGLLTARNIPRAAIYGAMASILVDFGIPILTTKDESETADVLFSIAKREQSDGKRDVAVRHDKVSMSDDERLRFIVEGLPGVSAVLAKRLLERFGTIHALVNASRAELMEVDGVGSKTADEVLRLVHLAYEAGLRDTSWRPPDPET